MALTDARVKAAKVKDGKRQTKLSDGGGLYMLVQQGGKYWRLNYRFASKQKTMALGVYPSTTLKEARTKRDAAKKLLDQHIDPMQQRKDDKVASIAKANTLNKQEAIDSNTFEVVGRNWFALRNAEWEPSHAGTVIRRLELYMFPVIGSLPIARLTRAQVAEAITAIVEHGTIDTAKRVVQITRNIFDYASDRGLIDTIPMGSSKNLLPVRKTTPMPAITNPKRIGDMLRAVYSYQGTFVVCQALKLLPLLAVRSGEFRTAEWGEFNLDDAVWTIPAAHRKLKKAAKENPDNVHIVPLSAQAVSILKKLQQLTGRGRHVFPSVRGDARPMSENTINAALHAMGFKGEMVGHGVRTMFSSSLNEQGFNPDAIERQLAHKEVNAVRAAYNRTEYMDERIKMIQHWADYLDGLRNGADVIPIGRRA